MGEQGEIKKYKSVVSTLAIVEEIIDNIQSEDELLRLCQNRSVFPVERLKWLWRKYGTNLKVLKFIYAKSLSKRLNLGYLWDKNIIPAPSGPRPFTQLSDCQFDMIIRDSETQVDFVD